MHTKPRILLYSHDTYGLGHLRRTLSLAHQLAQDVRGVHQLLLTGSMVAGAFGLPARADMIKLPALSKRSNGIYKARALPLTLKRTLAWRQEMILQAVVNFKPHLVLVDKSAAGVHGELLPALRYLRSWLPDTWIVLGMRDIEDGPEATIHEWAANGVESLLSNVYHRILLYGQRQLFDPVTAYNMPLDVQDKLTECGFLRRDTVLRDSMAIRGELGIDDRPLVVVTVGGGGDGFDIVRTHLQMLAGRSEPAPFHSLIATGPLMPAAKRTRLHRMARDLPCTLLDFTPDLVSYMAAADLVVSMAGYNSVCEILSLKKRAVLIPRMRIRTEQQLRATRLAQRGLVSLILPADLTPQHLGATIDARLQAPAPRVDLDMAGLRRASEAIRDMLAHPTSPISANGHGQRTTATRTPAVARLA